MDLMTYKPKTLQKLFIRTVQRCLKDLYVLIGSDHHKLNNRPGTHNKYFTIYERKKGKVSEMWHQLRSCAMTLWLELKA